MNQLKENNTLSIHRNGRFLIVELKKKHLVYSTSIIRGGHQEEIKYLLNHQSCEGAKHHSRAHIITDSGHQDYHQNTCKEAMLPPQYTAMMGTAADMQYAAISEESYKGINVTSIVTAGVTGNACRAGEQTFWHEESSGWEKCYQGTINTIVHINVPVLPSAICQAITTMTEAKTAALLDLAIPSKKGGDLATGTGTDQFCIASLCDETKQAKTSTSKHVKLGEMIATTVINATKKALQWQNGLEPSYTRSIFHALARFGLTEDCFLEEIKKYLKDESYNLLKHNLKSIIYHPGVSACAYALASVMDRIKNETFPEEMVQEILCNQFSLLACSLATKDSFFNDFNTKIKEHHKNPLDSTIYSIALGWSSKWNS